jgi:hypothetical protein
MGGSAEKMTMETTVEAIIANASTAGWFMPWARKASTVAYFAQVISTYPKSV